MRNSTWQGRIGGKEGIRVNRVEVPRDLTGLTTHLIQEHVLEIILLSKEIPFKLDQFYTAVTGTTFS